MSYRKNGCLKQAVGIIKEIKPYTHTKRFPFCKHESAIIILDMSEDLMCCVDKIDLYDIIDIRKINNQCCCGCEVQKPEKPTRGMKCVVGGPLTNKEVVSNG